MEGSLHRVHDSLRWLQRYLLAANIFNANALLSALLATMYLYKPPLIPPRGGEVAEVFVSTAWGPQVGVKCVC